MEMKCEKGTKKTKQSAIIMSCNIDRPPNGNFHYR